MISKVLVSMIIIWIFISSRCLSHQPSITAEHSCEIQSPARIITKKSTRGFDYVSCYMVNQVKQGVCVNNHILFSIYVPATFKSLFLIKMWYNDKMHYHGINYKE